MMAEISVAGSGVLATVGGHVCGTQWQSLGGGVNGSGGNSGGVGGSGFP